MPSPKNNIFYSTTKPLFEYLDKQKDNQKFIKSIEVSATLFFISFFLIFAIRPTFLTISSLLGEIKAKEASTKLMKAKINNLIQAQDNFAQVQENYSVVQSSLPDRPSFSMLANQVQSSAIESGFEISKIDFSLTPKEIDPKQNKNSVLAAKNYTINLLSPAPFSQFTDFVNLISNNRRLIDIESLSFATKEAQQSSDPEATPSSNLNSNFSASVYYWLP